MTQDLKNSKLPLPIKPPKSASEAFSSYSLFDQSSINILFNKDRKYSFDGITVDKQQQQHFWRRASLPKSNDICSKCHTKTITNYSTQPCGHRVCQNCTLSLEVPISIYASCSICVSLQVIYTYLYIVYNI
jgi:hypothetical protein